MLDKDTQPYGSITQPYQINALAVVEMSQMARRALDFFSGQTYPNPSPETISNGSLSSGAIPMKETGKIKKIQKIVYLQFAFTVTTVISF